MQDIARVLESTPHQHYNSLTRPIASWHSYAIIILGYYVTGWLGIWLTLPFANVTPFWPAAGISFAAFYWLGRRAILSILIAAITLDVHYTLAYDQMTLMHALKAVLIAFASLLQGWTGAFLVRERFSKQVTLSSMPQVLTTVILAGPVACLVPSLLGVMLETLLGNFTFSVVPVVWITWWMGDSLGVAIVTPTILLLALPMHKAMSWRQLYLPLMLIISLVAVMISIAAQLNQQTLLRQQEAQANLVIKAFQSGLNNTLDQVRNLAAFSQARDTLTRQDFYRFTQQQLKQSAALQVLIWAPWVDGLDREAMEQQARADGLLQFQITEQTDVGLLIAAKPRAYYLPIFYLEPFVARQVLIGLDLASVASQQATIEWVRANLQSQLSPPSNIYPKPQGTPHYLFYKPVIGEQQGRAELQGLIVGVIDTKLLLRNAMQEQSLGLLVTLRDATAGTKQVVVAPEESLEHSRTIVEYAFSVAGRQLEIALYKDPRYMPAFEDWLMWGILTLGLMVIAVMNALLVTVTSTRYLVAEEIRKQTANLEQQKQSAELATQIKSQFLANMSHEVRTPINAIAGLHHLALNETNIDKMKRYISQAVSSSVVLKRIINDILDYSNIEAGKLTLEKHPVAIRDVVLAFREYIRQEAERKGLHFQLYVDDAVPEWLLGDEVRLQQIILNLLSNALKFTSFGFVALELSYLPVEGVLRITVRDSGEGMTESQLNKVFQPFVQADESVTRRFGGTGLGLSIVKNLVQLMNGEITAESTLKSGSCFVVTLPLIKTAAPLTEAPQSVLQQAFSPDGHSVLVVEDNIINQQVVSAILEQAGYQVDCADNGKQALQRLQQRQYDLILMDIQMPVMDGLTTTKAIRAMSNGQNQLIIGLSANAMEEDKDAALLSGMNDYLTKPLEPELLLTTLANFLSYRVQPRQSVN